MGNFYLKSKIALLLSFCLVCLTFQNVSGFEISRSEVLEIEQKADRLGEKWSGEAIRRSIELYSKVAEDWEKLGEMRKASDSLRKAARSAQIIADYETALKVLYKALEIDKKINNIEGKIISQSLLSEIYRQKGDTGKSEKYYRQAIELSEQSSDNLAKANAYFSAGTHNELYGDIKTTLEFFNKAFSYVKNTEDKKLTAQIYRKLGAAYGRDGNYEAGFENAKKSLEIATEIDDKREQALSYFNIGFHHLLTNENQLALDNFKKAEKDYPNDVDLFDKASIANSIAYIYQEYGELDLSEKYRVEAIDLFEKAKSPTGVLGVLPYLAKLKRWKGEIEESKALYDRALKLAKELKDEFFIGIIYEHNGDADIESGDYDSAIKNYQATLAINRKLKIELPRIQNSLGRAFELKGDLESAQENYQKALDRNLEIKDFSPAAENLYNLANINVTLEDLDKALEYSNKSIELTESVYTDVDNNKLRRTFLSNTHDRYSLNIYLLMQMHERFPDKDFDRKALQTSERSRSRSLLENLQLSEAEFKADADPKLVEKEKENLRSLNENAEKLTQSLTFGEKKEEIKKIENQINELKNELEKIKGELRSKSPIYSSVKNPKDFDVREFQANVLDNETLFLEFAFGEKESYLWIIGKSSFDVITLPKRKILEDQLNELYNLLISRKLLENETNEDYAKRIAENELKFQGQAQKLSNQLFGKVADKLNGKRLVLATDGKLRYFPVSALPFPQSKDSEKINEPILLKNEVVYEPSATTLSLLTQKLNSAKTPEKDLLIFADPVYSPKDERLTSIPNESSQEDLDRSSTADLSGLTSSLPRLPATEKEAEAIIQTFGWSDTKLLTGFSATRENFFESDLADYKVLHFATHGLLNENHPEFSGLVFSKFDENGNSKRGIVRLQDIYGLNLKADLVVLSACDTGIGKDIKGEGLISLTDGFLQTGAKTVVSSRWKISDQATLELMKNFYEIMESEEIPPSKALQKAKIKLRNNPAFSSPYHWAAFTIQGDYLNKPNFTGGFGFTKYLFIPIAFTILIGLYFGIRRFR